ncbi:hypothetical protein G9A89_012873 [Geosiphon pyriformis]|nr:hypothetical protein G9A89_012873 [Geosiphon pyriformis]
MTDQEIAPIAAITAKEGQRNPFELLPDEIWLRIFMELPIPALCRCRVVSKKWKILSHDQTLWHHHSKEILPASFLAELKPNCTTEENNSGETNQNDSSFSVCTGWESIFRLYAITQKNWATSTAVRVTSFKAHDQRITVLKLKGNLAITGSSDNYCRVWNVRTMTRQMEVDVGADVNCIDFLVEKDILVCGSYYGEFAYKTFSLSRGKCLGQFRENHWVGTQCITINQDYIVLGSHNGIVYVIAWADGRKIAVFHVHRNPVAGVRLIGEDTVVSVSTNGAIDTFSIRENTRLHQYSIPNNISVCVTAFDEHGDGRNVMCISPTGAIIHLQWSDISISGSSERKGSKALCTEDLHQIFSQDPIIHYLNTQISYRILCAAMDGKFNRGVIGSCLAWPPKGGVLVYDFEKGLGGTDGIQGPNAEEDPLAINRDHGESHPVFTTLGMDIEKVVAGCSRGWVYCFEFVGEIKDGQEAHEGYSVSRLSPTEILEEVYL